MPDPDPDQAWKALSLVDEWLKHAEAKSGATLAAAGVAGGVLYNLVKNETHPGLWLSAVAVGCAISSVLSALFALAALAPQLTVPHPRAWRLGRDRSDDRVAQAAADDEADADAAQTAGEHDPTNLLFFGDIARAYRGNAPTYAEVLAALTSDSHRLTEHIARQVWANSHVSHRKYTWADRAIRALRVALVFLVITAAVVGKH